jgi:hypothetical protein
MEARKAYCSEAGIEDAFLRRAMEMVHEIHDFEERQEKLDEEFGITYELLKPYIEQYHETRGKRPKKAKMVEPESSAMPPKDESLSLEPGRDQPLGSGDIGDVRWAMSNLTSESANSKSAPTKIAWNLVVAARQSPQGLLKLMDIYKATVIQPQVKDAESGGNHETDRHLSDVLGRLEAAIGPEDA